MTEPTIAETILKRLDTYSNAIVTFTVLQGLVYSFYFGSNSTFNCRIKTSYLLAETLTISFISITTLSIVSVNYLGRQSIRLAPEFESVLSTVTKAKIVVIALFGYSCALLTYQYGIVGELPNICEKLIG